MRRTVRGVAWPALALLAAMTIITGVVYPVLVTVVAQVAFPHQAGGSLTAIADGRTIGSTLIGQAFSDDRYFWGRPSAAGAQGYDAGGSAGSNLGPTSRILIARIAGEVDHLQVANGGGPVPVDLVTASASGLDPHISPEAAEYQVARVATARGLARDEVRALLARHTEPPVLGFLGRPRVHVLELNLDLDGLLVGALP